MASWLGLTEPYTQREFNVDFPDEITAVTTEREVDAEMLTDGNHLKDIHLAPNTLVMLIKRKGSYLVPTGKTRLYLGDKLLIISSDKNS